MYEAPLDMYVGSNVPDHIHCDTVFGLGINCRSKMSILNSGLNTIRSPLDYMGVMDLNITINYLRNQFQDFFEKKNCYVNTHIDTNLRVTDRSNGTFSIHDFKNTNPANIHLSFETQYSEFKEKYNGITKVFLQKIQEVRTPVFVVNLDTEYNNCSVYNNLNSLLEVEKEIIKLRGGEPSIFYVGMKGVVPKDYYNSLNNFRIFSKTYTYEWGEEANAQWKPFMSTITAK